TTFAGINQVLLDGSNVTAFTTMSYSPPTAVGTYLGQTRFVAGSTHEVQVCWRDSANNTNAAALSFVVPQWFGFPTNLALPLAAADTAKVGLRAHAYQTYQNNNNNAWWTEEQIAGRRGPNLVGSSSLATESDGSETFLV